MFINKIFRNIITLNDMINSSNSLDTYLLNIYNSDY